MSESLTQLRAFRAAGVHGLVGIRAMPGKVAPVAVLRALDDSEKIRAVYLSLEDPEAEAYALRWMTCAEEPTLS